LPFIYCILFLELMTLR